MTELPENLRSVDWTRTTFEGARREQLRRWAELPLDRTIASLEEMEALTTQWRIPASVDMTLLAYDPALAEIVRRLVEVYRPLRIYLFGSKARGDDGPDSDYDLLVVVPDDASSERRDSRLAYEAVWDSGATADVLVCTNSYFEARRHLRASLPGTVLREGKQLHAA